MCRMSGSVIWVADSHRKVQGSNLLYVQPNVISLFKRSNIIFAALVFIPDLTVVLGSLVKFSYKRSSHFELSHYFIVDRCDTKPKRIR